MLQDRDRDAQHAASACVGTDGVFYLGEVVEYDTTDAIFTAPDDIRTEQYLTGRVG